MGIPAWKRLAATGAIVVWAHATAAAQSVVSTSRGQDLKSVVDRIERLEKIVGRQYQPTYFKPTIVERIDRLEKSTSDLKGDRGVSHGPMRGADDVRTLTRRVDKIEQSLDPRRSSGMASSMERQIGDLERKMKDMEREISRLKSEVRRLQSGR